jgi:D-arabinose 1-dehydrogenase-like Zn-dependent alcohol dehydrogenase
MDAIRINASEFIDERRAVVDCASLIAQEAVRELRAGANVVVSLRGVRGVSSSFFNVLLSAVAEVLQNDFSNQRFDVETETAAQKLILQRSLEAIIQRPC